MAERPILVLPNAAAVDRSPGRRFVPRERYPSPSRQQERLKATLDHIRDSFEGVAPSMHGLEPEFVVVFEAKRSLEEVAKQAEKLGLEWLAEWDSEAEQDSDFVVQGKPDEKFPLRMFAVMSDQKAIDRLIALWDRWQDDPGGRAETGTGKLRELFKTLRAVRRWDARDRVLDTGVLESWREDIAIGSDASRFEIELWFRADSKKRADALSAATEAVGQLGGSVIASSTLESIRYHGALVECPRDAVAAAIDAVQALENDQRPSSQPSLLLCEDVMFIRPRTQIVTLPTSELEEEVSVPEGQATGDDPLVALLDGLPLENHESLQGFMVVDDPDEFERHYEPKSQIHGTSMASLIINGDLEVDGQQQKVRVYVRPVLRPAEGSDEERAPDDTLFVDLVHRALHRIVVGDEGEEPSAPTVRIVNFSIGDEARAFSRELSPLARLLDWFSWKHKLLFMVSAGNHRERIVVGLDEEAIAAASDEELVGSVFESINSDRSQRRILAPAESVNALAVGALHVDSSDAPIPNRAVDLLRGHPYPSPVSRMGLGYLRSVKPDLIMPGGRQTFRPRLISPPGSCELERVDSPFAPGIGAAHPGQAGGLTAKARFCGTSVATALGARLAAQVFELVRELTESNPEFDDSVTTCIAKALVVHAARWRDPLELLGRNNDEHWSRRRRGIAALMGFGSVEPELALLASEKRVILIGGGFLGKDAAHRYDIPMPEVLGNKEWQRRFVTTLAWMTPVNMRSRKYRKARLSLSSQSAGEWFEPTTQADEYLATRGTVAHLHRESSKRVVVPEDGLLDVQVNCAEDAAKLSELVPYGLAVTLEVAEPVEVDIHAAVRARLGLPIRPRA